MKYEIKVVPKAKRNCVKLEGSSYKVYVTAPAAEDRANKAVIAVLAEYFKVRKNQVEIIKGLKSRAKTIIIYKLKS